MSRLRRLWTAVLAALLIAALAGCIGVFVAGRLESRVFDVMRSFASQFEQQETKFILIFWKPL